MRIQSMELLNKSEKALVVIPEAPPALSGIQCKPYVMDAGSMAGMTMKVLIQSFLNACLLILLLCASPDSRGEDGIAWDALSEETRQLLQGLEGSWDQFSPERRQNLIRGAERWNEMPPGERREMQQRFRDWRERSPAERRAIRQRFERFRSLAPAQQQRLRDRQRWFNDLSPDQRRTLRETFRNRSPDQQRPFGRRNGSERNGPPPRGR